MAMTEFAKEYHEKMLPGHISTLQVTDPEFIERFDNFAFMIMPFRNENPFQLSICH